MFDEYLSLGVAKQLIAYLHANNLNVIYQSAYRKLHNTETVLIRVHNDIAMALDHKRSVILLLLDQFGGL